MFRGFGDRLLNEMRQLAPSGTKVSPCIVFNVLQYNEQYAFEFCIWVDYYICSSTTNMVHVDWGINSRCSEFLPCEWKESNNIVESSSFFLTFLPLLLIIALDLNHQCQSMWVTRADYEEHGARVLTDDFLWFQKGLLLSPLSIWDAVQRPRLVLCRIYFRYLKMTGGKFSKGQITFLFTSLLPRKYAAI